MFSPLLCGTGKGSVIESSSTPPLQRQSSASSETVASRGRPSSSGRGGRSRSVDDMLETNGGESPFSKAKKSFTPGRMRSFAELFRPDRLSSTSPPTIGREGGREGAKAVTFGIPLSELCSQSPVGVPNLVAKVTQFVEDCCLDMEGVYRLSPNARIIEALKVEFDKTGDADLGDADPASVSCLLKLFLRELPEPLIPVDILQQVVAKGDMHYPPPSSYLEFLHDVLSDLPAPNYALLKYLIRHLHIVSRHHAKNKMNAANLAIVFGPNLFSFGGSLDFLMNQTSSMPALKTMIEYYKDIFCDHPLGQGGMGHPAVPKPYKQHRADAVVYEEVSFVNSTANQPATRDSGAYEIVEPPPLQSPRGHGLHSTSSNDEVLDAVAPDDHHVMQNGVMYAVVNKKRKPTSTDGKTDMLIPTDEKRGTSTSTEGIRDTPTSTEGIRDTPTSTEGIKDTPTSTEGIRDTSTSTEGIRDTPTSTEGIRDTPTSTEGIRDTPTSTNRGMCSSKPSGYNGYEEIDVDFTLAKKKGGHHVTSSAGVSPRREQAEESRSPSPLTLNSSSSPYNSPSLTPRRAKALDEAISETVQDLLFNPLQNAQPGKDDAWINVTAARQTNVSTAGPTEVSTARPTEVSTAGLTDVSMARLNDVSTSGQTDVPTPEQTDVSMARKMRRNKKSSKGGVENRSQSLQGEEFPVARRRLVTSERKLRNRSSGAYFTESLDVLEHQGDFPDGSCEGLSPESTVKKRLKMFEHKPVMGLLPGSGGEVVDASTEGSVEQTDGNTFVFEGVTLTRAPPLQHLTKTRTKGPRGRRRSGDCETDGGGAEMRGRSTLQPVTMELVKPESDTSQGKVTVEQMGVVREEHRGVVTEKQSGLVAVKERGVVNEKQGGVVIEDGRGVVRMNLSGQSNAGEPKGANEFLLKVTEHIQSTLREKRQKYDRPEELHEMTWEQLLDDKKSVQTAILQFEKQHGRPQTKSGKDIMKPVYHRYRDIKKRISEGRGAHEVARKSSPSPEHSTLEATLPNVTLSHSLPPQLWRDGGSKVASEMVAQQSLATPTGWGPNPASTSRASTTANEQSLSVLEDQKAQWEEEKSALRKELRSFERAFEAQHGRLPTKADRPGPIDSQYTKYKRVRSRLRSSSADPSIAAQLHQTV